MEISVRMPDGHARTAVVGAAERNLKMIREALGVRISSRDGVVRLAGDEQAVAAARSVLERLRELGDSPKGPTRDQVLALISEEADRARLGIEGAGDLAGSSSRVLDDPGAWDGRLSVYSGGRPVRPRTPGQQAYIEAIRDHDLVFGIGPAGTGKTYLAVAAAIHLLRESRVRKLILARPAVEAGEKLGFLPGDLEAKVNPYLRPLLDALHDMLDHASVRRFMDNDVVEVAPLAFMRGRTLNNAVVILDEAQNTTAAQMKMFLTRLGHGSKMVVTGDTTQIDLPDPTASGLIDAARRLRRVRGVGFVTLTGQDVVRHSLVQRVIAAYGDQDPTAEGVRAYGGELHRALEDGYNDDDNHADEH